MDLCKNAPRFPAAPPAGSCTPDARGPALLLALALPSDLPGGIWTSPVVLLFELLFIGIAFGLLGIWLKEREVAARIAGMDASIEAIKTGSSVPPRLPAIGGDPVSRFVDEVNLMLDEVERSRQELRESRDRYHLLFDSGNDFLLVCAVGREGTPYRILDANALACRCLGYAWEELFAVAPRSIILIRSDFARGDHQFYSADLIPREGERIPVEASIHRISLGGTPAILIIARDVTERRRAEKELMDYRYRLEELVTQRTNELQMANESLRREMKERERIEGERREAYRQIERNIEQFAVLTDHIRNPLQVVQGMADLIDDERAEKIREQVRQIKAILRQLDDGWVESEKVREYLERYR
ncbi:MAG: Putative PAS/PAC sensor protein [Methanoculleus marisnigri]|jgi:PAS domain S-box|uniref:Putative PAS/PAC sensor protein n=1 Tax=Methanoculleus marisnigri TaxID=2198 RepID=A0A101J2K4_9EURY|nr:PAS domain S-box protein [Methanoculleus marisnigri]KUL05661.1 MAG: Putative PAS/PAC sensor protein [Methanoculleus marisnigri]